MLVKTGTPSTPTSSSSNQALSTLKQELSNKHSQAGTLKQPLANKNVQARTLKQDLARTMTGTTNYVMTMLSLEHFSIFAACSTYIVCMYTVCMYDVNIMYSRSCVQQYTLVLWVIVFTNRVANSTSQIVFARVVVFMYIITVNIAFTKSIVTQLQERF